jgi:hypothetical protein
MQKFKAKIISFLPLIIGLICGSIIEIHALPFLDQDVESKTITYFLTTTFIAGIISALPVPSRWWLGFIGVFGGLILGTAVADPVNILYLPLAAFGCAFSLMWVPSVVGSGLVFLIYREQLKRRDSGEI